MIGNSSLNNGSNELTWGWTPTMARASLNFGELTAATGGSVVSGLSNQPIMQLSTVSGSTAAPLYLYQAGLTSASGSPAPPALQINSTWNNTGVTDSGIVESITNTVSGAGSTLLNLLVGGTSVYSISPQGNTTAAGTATAGTFASTSTTGPALKVANTSGASINATVPTALITIAGGTDAVNNGISGAFIGRGANNSSSVAAASAGSAYLQGGSLTTAGSAGSFGLVQVDAYYWRGTIANSGDVVCQTTTAYTVSDCAVTPAVNVIGVVSGTIGNPAQVAIEGTAGVHIDNTATIGDFICLSTTTAGLGHDNGAVICPTAGAQVGIVTAVSGTPDSITLSTTFPAVTLHFR
jgi:hypothetical protein